MFAKFDEIPPIGGGGGGYKKTCKITQHAKS